MALADEYDDLLVKGISCAYCGIGHYAAADYEQGLVRSKEAIDALEKAGDLWELHLAQFHRGCCHFGLGDVAETVTDARDTFASSARLVDSRMMCSSYLWARATRGNLPFEQLKSCFPNRPDDVMSTVHGIMAEGHWHRFHGRTKESLQMFERAGELIRMNLCVNSHMIVALPEIATALRLRAETIEANDLDQSKLLRRRAYRLAKWAARIMQFFPAAYPMTLREWSLNLRDQGYLCKALKMADKSCAVAESQKARFEYAQSLLVRGQIARQLGLPEADDQIRTAEVAIEAMDKAASTVALG
jgi:two-component system sensor kinase